MFLGRDKRKVKDSKEAEATVESEAKPQHGTPSIISAGLTVNGDLATDGDIQIDGTLEGDVETNLLTIGESAAVTGQITAERTVVRGRVTGRIQSREVVLAKTARVIGDILHENLAMEAGAFLEGHCKRMDAQGSKSAKSTAGADAAIPLKTSTATRPLAPKASPEPEDKKKAARY